jgi:hypothetical protein
MIRECVSNVFRLIDSNKSWMRQVRNISRPWLCQAFNDVTDASWGRMINLNSPRCLSPRDDHPLNSSFLLILLNHSWCRGWTILHRCHRSGNRGYMRGWISTIITIIFSNIKDLLANFVITCTLKKQTNCMVGSRRRLPPKFPWLV